MILMAFQIILWWNGYKSSLLNKQARLSSNASVCIGPFNGIKSQTKFDLFIKISMDFVKDFT